MLKCFGDISIKKGDIIIDLGAHKGDDTAFFSKKVGDGGWVISIEPVIENYLNLLRRIIDGRLYNVTPILSAIDKETGKATIYLAGHSTAHSLFFTKGFSHQGELGHRTVPTISWDYLVEALCLDHVDLAKVDIEGAEVLLLEGMNRVLPDIILMEEHSRLGVELGYLLHLLESKGYETKVDGSYLYSVRVV